MKREEEIVKDISSLSLFCIKMKIKYIIIKLKKII